MSRRKRRLARRRTGPGLKEYLLAMVVTVMTGLGVGVLVGEAYAPPSSTLSEDPTASETTPPVAGGFSLIPKLAEPLNILVMATDVNYTIKNGKRVMGLAGNTDSMILARFDPAQPAVRMLSIPRDTRVPIPGHGTFKINSANPYGGPTLAARVVADFLDVTVDRYVLFNTRAVIQLVDAIGGINVFVPKRLYYNDYAGKLHINLKKGMNHLDGQRAHDFLRFRHDELGDIGRVQRQQAFLQSCVSQYMTPANLIKTPQLLSMARENLETNLTNDELLKLVTMGKDLNRERIQLSMVPGSATTIESVSYWVADDTATKRLVNSFLIGQSTEARAPRFYRVAIRDGIGDHRGISGMRAAVAEAGYGQVDLDGPAAEMGQATTQIIAQNADVAGAKALAEKLGVGRVVVAATGNIYSDFTVVMGRDWMEHLAAHPVVRRQ